MLNLVWRTPGPDTGRDIEGHFAQQDLSGQTVLQVWYVECKRYTAAIDWPTVWQKLSYADNLGADFLLLVTNSNPSPACETQISQWNAARRGPQIRVWRGYDLHRVLVQFPIVALKYGILEPHMPPSSGFLELALDLTKMVQSAYVANALEMDYRSSLETAAAVAELLSWRMSDISEYGRLVASGPDTGREYYDWLDTDADIVGFDEVSVRALSAAARYITASARVEIRRTVGGITMNGIDARRPPSEAGQQLLIRIGLWTDLELSAIDPARPFWSIRKRTHH